MLKILCIFILINFVKLNSQTLEDLRTNYSKAVYDSEICKNIIEQLEKNTNKESIMLAYLGAFQAIKAKHVFNPINKLKYFNRGKKNIDKAIISSPNDLEIRFLRYSIQKNSPKILGYRKNLEEDTKFLKSNLNNISSSSLKNLIINILK